MVVPNAAEWKSIFAEIFHELDNCPIHRSAEGSFDAVNPLKYSSKRAANYR